MPRDAAWYDAESNLARIPLILSPWLGLYHLAAQWLAALQGTQWDRGVIDLGCGTGRFAQLLWLRGYTRRYLGVDFAPGLVHIAAETVRGWSFQVGDLSDPALIDQLRPLSGSLVILEVLEHLEDDLALLRAFQTRPVDRHVIFSVPNFPSAAHERHFDSLAAVIDRYAPHVQIERTGMVDLSPPQDRAIYLIDGFV